MDLLFKLIIVCIWWCRIVPWPYFIKSGGAKGAIQRKRIPRMPSKHERAFSNLNGLYEWTTSTKKLDILTLSDTHRTTDEANIYEIPGNIFINRCRIQDKYGGGAMYIGEDINLKRRHDLKREHTENITIVVILKKLS